MELNRQFAKVSSLLLHSISTIQYIEYRKSRHSEDYIGCVHTGRLLVWESGSHVAVYPQTKTYRWYRMRAYGEIASVGEWKPCCTDQDSGGWWLVMVVAKRTHA